LPGGSKARFLFPGRPVGPDWFGSVDPAFERGGHGGSPDLVTVGIRVQHVTAETRQLALGIEELVIDVRESVYTLDSVWINSEIHFSPDLICDIL
jgi:hypothetical protein